MLVSACVFTPPPPLPEELAEQQAEAAARTASVRGGRAAGPDEGEGSEGEASGGGDPPELGMTAEQMRAYATAQGDPEGGAFTLEQALDGVPPDGELWARFVLDAGEIECRLFEDRVPLTVANFVGLARGRRPSRDPETREWSARPYYDGTAFHRVIEGFMIQGGDPTGTGQGSPGYVIADEFHPALRHDRAGMLSMANRGPGSGGGQFFITLAPTPHLDDKHAIFGECTDASVGVAETIAASGGLDDRPSSPQTITSVEIERRPPVSDSAEAQDPSAL